MTRVLVRIINNRHEHGHRLWITSHNGQSMVYCSRCHGYGTQRAPKLSRPCVPLSGKQGYGPVTGRRLRRRRHPQNIGELAKPVRLYSQVATWLTDRLEAEPPDAAVVAADGEAVGPPAPLPEYDEEFNIPPCFAEEEDVFNWGPAFYE